MSSSVRFGNAKEVFAAIGREVNVTDWVKIEQARIDTFTVTVEIEGEDKPAVVAESVVRRYLKAEGAR